MMTTPAAPTYEQGQRVRILSESLGVLDPDNGYRFHPDVHVHAGDECRYSEPGQADGWHHLTYALGGTVYVVPVGLGMIEPADDDKAARSDGTPRKVGDRVRWVGHRAAPGARELGALGTITEVTDELGYAHRYRVSWDDGVSSTVWFDANELDASTIRRADDALAGMRGPDGELGTDVEPEAYLDQQDDAREAAALQAEWDGEA